jgi:hypothetical protein
VSYTTFLLFYDFITGRLNTSALQIDMGVSRTTLWRRFAPLFAYLAKPNMNRVVSNTSSWVYGLDGKWLHRNGVVILHRDSTHQHNIYWSYHRSESYAAYTEDLTQVLSCVDTTHLVGIVSDWKGAIVSAVETHLSLPHQRCLTHVVREAKRYLPKRSTSEAVQSLRILAQRLIHITTYKEKQTWIASLILWEKQYGHILKEKTTDTIHKRWWYSYPHVRRAWRLLTHNWDPFFIHLTHPLIPHSNNALEGTISQASQKLLSHRGMQTMQQVSFLFWYFTFTQTKTQQDRKELWDRIQDNFTAV